MIISRPKNTIYELIENKIIKYNLENFRGETDIQGLATGYYINSKKYRISIQHLTKKYKNTIRNDINWNFHIIMPNNNT